MADGTTTIMKLMADAAKHRDALAKRAAAIRRMARTLESKSMTDQRRIRKELETARGDRREILEAQYADAVDRQRKASQAFNLAAQTLAKLGTNHHG